jgi:alpha-L-fucosidase
MKRKLPSVFIGLIVALLLLTGGVMAQDGVYEPTFESLSTHPMPDWFQNAKLGIFIHWGVYSVPGYAPLTGELGEVLATEGWPYWFANNPYAEWYYNSMKVEDSATQRYHEAVYGADATYFDFVPQFNALVRHWNPEEWASLFAGVGARYVVLTTKHHDGFLLWTSEHPNPFREGYQVERDLVGELTDAVRAAGMEMGLYYSGGIDWTFSDVTIRDFPDLFVAIPQSQEYADYANAHWRELIARYQPRILWNDLGYPQVGEPYALFAEYYNAIPDGVINNRFSLGGLADPTFQFHADFTTPEYAQLEDIDPNKWESTRGLGYSFGFNRLDTDDNMLSEDGLIDSFIDIVSKGGNLLLNIGPMADGTIPNVQRARLLALGSWLDVHGEAIFDTLYWERAEGTVNGDIPVRFTSKAAERMLYAIMLETPEGTTLRLADVQPGADAQVSLLGYDGEVSWSQDGDDMVITLSAPLQPDYAHTIAILLPSS